MVLLKNASNGKSYQMDEDTMKPLKHYTDSPIFKAFGPFFIGMKLLGLYHRKEYNKQMYGKDQEEIPPLRKRVTPSSIYSMTIVTLLWLNFFRLLTVLHGQNSFGPALFQKLIMIFFLGLTSICATSCFIACHKYTNLPEFFHEWTKLRQEYPGRFFPPFWCRNPVGQN